MARCQKGSANCRKGAAKVARAHRKVRNARRDFLHRASTSLVRTADLIAIEDLLVRNMVRNRHLARAISDCGWGEFRRQLEYKCERYGRRLVVIDRWYPSSKTCSACGHLLADLSLSTRQWRCPSCGARHDRDINAAQNILAAGRAVARGSPGDACGADVRHSGSSRVRSAVKQEPQPRGPESPSFRAGSSQVVDLDPCLIERAHHPRGQPFGCHHGNGQPLPALVRLDAAHGVRLARDDRRLDVRALGQDHLEVLPPTEDLS